MEKTETMSLWASKNKDESTTAITTESQSENKRKFMAVGIVKAWEKEQEMKKRKQIDDDYHGCPELVEVEPEVLEAISRMYDRYDKEILLYSSPFVPIVVPADVIPIVYDLLELTREGVDLYDFCLFAQQCLDRCTLQVYDHPGDPRCGGFMHWEGKYIREKDRKIAAFALDQYLNLSNKGCSLEVKEVNKMSRTMDNDAFYYVTFTVADKLNKDELAVFQAQVIETGWYNFKLGILRDASHDRVLAAIKFKQGACKGTELVDQMSPDEKKAITQGLRTIPEEARELLIP